MVEQEKIWNCFTTTKGGGGKQTNKSPTLLFCLHNMSQLFGDLHRPGSLPSSYSFGLFPSVIYLFNVSPSVAGGERRPQFTTPFSSFFFFCPSEWNPTQMGGSILSELPTLSSPGSSFLPVSRLRVVAAACCYIALHLGGVA
jgi:hypothetical protein